MSPSALSVQLYTVRSALAEDLRGTLARVADIGFRSVELYGFVDRVEEYEKALAEAGLVAPSAHARLVLADDLEPILAATRRLGIATLIDPHIPAERWQTRDSVLESAARVNEIARRGADAGVTIGYHNHYWELESRIDGVPALEVFADALDDGVVLEVDTYWAEVGGVPAADLLRRLGERVRLIHVKDGPVTRSDEDQVAVGSGAVDIPAILEAAPQATRVVELDGFAGDVFDALRDSFAYLAEREGRR